MQEGSITVKHDSGIQYRITDHGKNILTNKLRLLEIRWHDMLELLRSQTIDSYEYTQNSHELQDLNSQIQKVNNILSHSSDLTPDDLTHVCLGTWVSVETEGEIRTYQIVSSVEADPKNGYISDQCPLGAALIGKQENDHINVMHANLTREYTIKSITV